MRRPLSAAEPDLILVICSGNTCRSPMATSLLGTALAGAGLGQAYVVESAGTVAAPGLPATREACQVVAERNLDLSSHRSRPVTQELLARAKLILTMTRQHQKSLLVLYPGAADRLFTFKGFAAGPGSGTAVRSEDGGAGPGDPGRIGSPQAAGGAGWSRAPVLAEDIADPIGHGIEAYRRTAGEIERAVAAVVERLTNPPDLAALLGGRPVGTGADQANGGGRPADGGAAMGRAEGDRAPKSGGGVE